MNCLRDNEGFVLFWNLLGRSVFLGLGFAVISFVVDFSNSLDD
ncbi:hypothetical protein [Bdellovibrio bacteriovorus]|nr:hypothetical protein [Bdellovibrio bacteriovorus]